MGGWWAGGRWVGGLSTIWIIWPKAEPEPEIRFQFARPGYGFSNSGSGIKEPDLVCANSGFGQKNRN